jgi:hypothetical protein
MAKINRQPKAINLSSLGNINTEINTGYILNNITDETTTIEETKNNEIIDNNIQNVELQTDNISNVIINKIKNLGINMKSENIKLEISDKKGDCLRLIQNVDNSYVDFKVQQEGILTIKPTNKTILIHSNNKIDTAIPLTLLNHPNITSENNLGVGLNFDIKNNINTIKTFGSISILGNNVTNNKETSKLNIDLINNGKINNNTLTLTSDGVLSIKRLVESSDIRIKENIKLTNIKESYNKIMKIKVKDYNYISDKKKKLYSGVIAQELKDIIPNAVNIESNNIYDDFHTVSTKEILYHIIAAIQYIELNKD